MPLSLYLLLKICNVTRPSFFLWAESNLVKSSSNNMLSKYISPSIYRLLIWGCNMKKYETLGGGCTGTHTSFSIIFWQLTPVWKTGLHLDVWHHFFVCYIVEKWRCNALDKLAKNELCNMNLINICVHRLQCTCGCPAGHICSIIG